MNGSRLDSRDIALLALLALAALFLFGWKIGSYPLWDPWEPKYAQAMRETMDRGEFITPYLNGKIRWTKPIFIYWAMYLPMLIGGNNEITARLPSVLGGVLGVLALYYVLRRLRGRLTAFMGAAVLMTLPQYYFMARQAMPDTFLTVFLGCAMGFFALGRFGIEPRRLHFGLFYASVALAFLTKGPVAPVIVLGSLMAFWLIELDPKRLLSVRTVWADLRASWSRYHVGLGIVVFVVVAAPWYVAMLIEHGWTFVESFIVGENLHRFSGTVRGHAGVISHYVQALFHGMYPWSGFLPLAGLFLIGRAHKLDDEVRLKWYFFSWGLAVFVVFTAASTKIDHYILPITPAVAVLVALVWESFLREDAPAWVRPVFLLSTLFVLLVVRDFVAESSKYIFDTFTTERSIRESDVDLAMRLFFGAWLAVMLLGMLLRRRVVVAALAVSVCFANAVYFSHAVVPKHAKYRSLKLYTDHYDAVSDAGPLIYFGNIRYSMHYYYDRSKYRKYNGQQARTVARDVRGEPNVYIIAQKKYRARLLRALGRDRETTWRYVFGDREHPVFSFLTNDPRAPGDPIELE